MAKINNKDKVLYGKEDDEHNTEEIQEEILVPNEQENTPENTTDTNERDVPQLADNNNNNNNVFL